MAEEKGPRQDTNFNFHDYMNSLIRQQGLLQFEYIDDEIKLERQLKKLIARADHFITEKKLLTRQVSVKADGLDYCLLASTNEDGVTLDKIPLKEDETEISATYQGLHLSIDELTLSGIEKWRRPQAYHQLVVNTENIRHPLYNSYLEQCAILPIIDSSYLRFTEE